MACFGSRNLIKSVRNEHECVRKRFVLLTSQDRVNIKKQMSLRK